MLCTGIGGKLKKQGVLRLTDLVLDWDPLPVLLSEPSRINTHDQRHSCPHEGLIWHLPKGIHWFYLVWAAGILAHNRYSVSACTCMTI